MLQRCDCLSEVEDFPDCDAEIQEPHATDSATHPAGSDDSLQSLNARLARGI